MSEAKGRRRTKDTHFGFFDEFEGSIETAMVLVFRDVHCAEDSAQAHEGKGSGNRTERIVLPYNRLPASRKFHV